MKKQILTLSAAAFMAALTCQTAFALDHDVAVSYTHLTEVVEPDPISPNESTSYSNLYHCDRDGVYLYIDTVSGQLTDAIRNSEVQMKELFNCIALMSVTSFVGLEKTFLILRLKMRKVFLQPNVCLLYTSRCV